LHYRGGKQKEAEVASEEPIGSKVRRVVPEVRTDGFPMDVSKKGGIVVARGTWVLRLGIVPLREEGVKGKKGTRKGQNHRVASPPGEQAGRNP